MHAQGRITCDDWDLYDTRHVVFQPQKLTPAALEAGYWRAYRDFYRWSAICRGAWAKADWTGRLRHLGYAAGWKKFESLWDWVIRARRAGRMLPMLELILSGFGQLDSTTKPEKPNGGQERAINLPVLAEPHSEM